RGEPGDLPVEGLHLLAGDEVLHDGEAAPSVHLQLLGAERPVGGRAPHGLVLANDRILAADASGVGTRSRGSGRRHRFSFRFVQRHTPGAQGPHRVYVTAGAVRNSRRPPAGCRRKNQSSSVISGYTPFSSCTSRPVTGGLNTHTHLICVRGGTRCLSWLFSRYTVPGFSACTSSVARSMICPSPSVLKTASLWLAYQESVSGPAVNAVWWTGKPTCSRARMMRALRQFSVWMSSSVPVTSSTERTSMWGFLSVFSGNWGCGLDRPPTATKPEGPSQSPVPSGSAVPPDR